MRKPNQSVVGTYFWDNTHFLKKTNQKKTQTPFGWFFCSEFHMYHIWIILLYIVYFNWVVSQKKTYESYYQPANLVVLWGFSKKSPEKKGVTLNPPSIHGRFLSTNGLIDASERRFGCFFPRRFLTGIIELPILGESNNATICGKILHNLDR